MKKGTTIVDIAKALNVTASTVSRALHDHPSISRETKKMVLETAEKLNYHPNSFATNLRKGRGNLIGLVVPHINRHFFSNVIHGVEAVANVQGYNVLICQSQESFEKEKEAIKSLINSRVEGIIISISKETKDERHLMPAIEKGIAVVQFDRTLGSVDSHQVLNDNLAGAYEAVNHLVSQGYQRIAHFGGPQIINIYVDRYRGYQKALEDNRLALNEKWVIHDSLTQQVAFDATKRLFTQKTKPDAIFAVSDYAALGALIALRDLGLNVPDEVGIVGFANEPFTSLVSPSLSTVEQFSGEIGKMAAEKLLEQVCQGDNVAFIAEKVNIKPMLLVRKSSSRIKA